MRNKKKGVYLGSFMLLLLVLATFTKTAFAEQASDETIQLSTNLLNADTNRHLHADGGERDTAWLKYTTRKDGSIDMEFKYGRNTKHSGQGLRSGLTMKQHGLNFIEGDYYVYDGYVDGDAETRKLILEDYDVNYKSGFFNHHLMKRVKATVNPTTGYIREVYQARSTGALTFHSVKANGLDPQLADRTQQIRNVGIYHVENPDVLNLD